MKTKFLISAFLLISCVHFSYGQWTTTYLSAATIRMGGAVAGNKAYFAGGDIAPGSVWVDSKKVEIYNVETGVWQLDSLSVARVLTTGVTCGSKVFFAGGTVNGTSQHFSTVDIYNTLTDVWIVRNLSVPRFELSAVSKDSMVLFAGGHNITLNTSYDVVDVYNINTDQWSTKNLSIPRGNMGCTKVGDLAFFAGGTIAALTSWYNRVDIYNFSTGTWDTASLSQARGFIGACTVGNKVLFAGGMTANGVPSNRVDIYDYTTDTWTIDSLSLARGFANHQVVQVYGKAYFVGGGTFKNGVWKTDSDTIDIYDSETGVWSVMTMPNRLNNHTVVAVDTAMLIAGGFTYTSPQIGFPQLRVEIYVDPSVGITSKSEKYDYLEVFPNPNSGNIHFDIGDRAHISLLASIFNMQGQMVFSKTLLNDDRELNLQLPVGVYVLRVIAEDKVYSELITIQK